MVRRERTRKRRTRRGGGILNRVRGFFTRKRGTVAPAPTGVATAQPRPASRWKFPNVKSWFTRRRPVQPQIQENTRNKNRYMTEDFPSAFQRVFWYVKKRYEGRTHEELIPYLDIPGSFAVSTGEYNTFKNQLLDIIRQYDTVSAAAEFLKVETPLGISIDQEINNWESAKRLTPEEIRLKCIQGKYCLLYPGTRQEQLPFDNVANGLTRFLGILLEHESIPDVIQYKTNYARVCTDTANRYQIFSQSTLFPVGQIADFEIAFGKSRAGVFFTDYVVIDAKFRRRAPSQVPTYYPQGCYDEILSMYTITGAVVNKEIYLMHPRFAYIFMNKYPDLYEEAFGEASGWKDMSPLEQMRMALVCWYAGRYLLSRAPDGPRARDVYLTYPEPALSTIQSIPEDSEYMKTIQFPNWFEKYQDLIQSDSPSEKVIPFDTYLSMLQERQQSLTAQRNQLFARPAPSLPPINLSAAVPYDPETALTTINRVIYYSQKFRNPLLTVQQKAQAKTLLNLARIQKKSGNILMKEKELAEIEPFFRVKSRPTWSNRHSRKRRNA